MVVLGVVKVLTEAGVSVVIVFGTFDIEVADPSKLAVYITVLSDL